MKKFYQLTPDQKKTRVILIISIVFGLCVMAGVILKNAHQGLFDLKVLGLSVLIGIAVFVGTFVAIVSALVQKDKPVL